MLFWSYQGYITPSLFESPVVSEDQELLLIRLTLMVLPDVLWPLVVTSSIAEISTEKTKYRIPDKNYCTIKIHVTLPIWRREDLPVCLDDQNPLSCALPWEGPFSELVATIQTTSSNPCENTHLPITLLFLEYVIIMIRKELFWRVRLWTFQYNSNFGCKLPLVCDSNRLFGLFVGL